MGKSQAPLFVLALALGSGLTAGAFLFLPDEPVPRPQSTRADVAEVASLKAAVERENEALRARVDELEAEARGLRQQLAARPVAAPIPEGGVAAAEGALAAEIDPELAAMSFAELLQALAGEGGWRESGKLGQVVAALRAEWEEQGAGALDALLAAALADPTRESMRALLTAIQNLKANGLLTEEDDPAIRAALLEAGLAKEDAAESRAIFRLLTDLALNGMELREADIADLTKFISGYAPGAVRAEAMNLLRRTAKGHEPFRDALRSIVRSDEDNAARRQAYRELSRMKDPAAAELMRHLLEHEVDPGMLIEAANIENIHDPNQAQVKDFREGLKVLLARDVEDGPRAMAAASLSMVAIITGDPEAAPALQALASSTSDPTLAEIARTTAKQLEEGTASWDSLEDQWRPWMREHLGIDRW